MTQHPLLKNLQNAPYIPFNQPEYVDPNEIKDKGNPFWSIFLSNLFFFALFAFAAAGVDASGSAHGGVFTVLMQYVV
ncbi:MAG: hypothetical protein WCP97_03975, partial [bacterium]